VMRVAERTTAPVHAGRPDDAPPQAKGRKGARR
jgi:hypothetical protein